MIIAQISDTHILAKSSDQPAGVSRADILRRCIADINEQSVDAVIHTGDSVQHAQPGEYAYLREILGELNAPLFLVPGNRDRHDALRAAFDDFSYLPKSGELLHYAIDEYPMRLVGLDSVTDGERKGVFDARRHAWLDETLALEPDKPTLLFIHHPPFDVVEAGYTGGYRDTEDARALTALVSRHPQVRRLLVRSRACLAPRSVGRHGGDHHAQRRGGFARRP